jgi:signal transduction histidine kinase
MTQPAGRLLAITIALMIVLTLVSGLVMTYAARRYTDELSQRLNSNIAMYVDRESKLIAAGKPDVAAVDRLAAQAMVINPLARVYLLDADGTIIGGGQGAVDLRPVRAFLKGTKRGPIYGDDPTTLNGRRVFSAAPVKDTGRIAGYVYVVLGSDDSSSLAAAVASSNILQVALILLGVLLALTIATAILVTQLVSRPLAQLHARTIQLAATLDDHAAPDPAGRTKGLAAVVVAVEKLAATARTRLEELQATDQTRRTLFESIGHDLRTPLAAACGYVETLQHAQATLTPETRQQYLDVVHRHCQRLTRLVAQIFQLSRLESRSLELRLEPLLLQELVQDIAAKFGSAHPGSRVVLDTQLDAAAPAVSGNFELLESVIENLIDNAIRHGALAGRVRLQVTAVGGEVIVKIQNEGPGMSADDMRLLHGPGPDGVNGRRGLGLAIVIRALRHLNTRLELHSHPGSGTTASFRLPATA